ncbi:hypothetical protein A2960_05120 [Candidatus Gottesmanbacteria bacterium RIFCSPLOWO2_01_FULL_39_12b]|uniref:GHMP kinase N-terminal domain-containing protein n=1 Tax=Candidatus Gottesmanbacteria bacterium RIFCSPLOWO2_01_FULL_39_12b TaxID=1798388 RepID=A0A1F6ALX5_9BACT|nr:MAG: hypothetical protein A2960_05120 [Candidatus Gottesmanbacteria bacterium RIFCSPLOWO2_01_FULL_39_12b]
MATALCPASLSFIFKAVFNADPLKTGSIGIGCTVNKNVKIRVQRSSSKQILFNGKKINFPTVSTLINSLTKQPFKVEIESSLPLGFGFGISSSATLASAFAVSKALKLKRSRDKLIRLSHMAEIFNHTGLGSVVTSSKGGFLLKTKAGIPSVTINFPFVGQKLYAVIIDKLTTPSILNSKTRLAEINRAADVALGIINQNLNLRLKDVIDVAYNFSLKAGLLTDERVAAIINRIRKTGGHATMAILGQVVISDTIPKLKENYRIEELTITDNIVTLCK